MRVTSEGPGTPCPTCGRHSPPGTRYCPVCGAEIATGPTPQPASGRGAVQVTLVLLDRGGSVLQQYPLSSPVTSLGRQGADINFPDDGYLSPLHAQIINAAGEVRIRDLGSRNGTWLFLDQPHRLADGDLLLVGGQMFRFRRLGYPGPRPPEQDQTRRMGSLVPGADIASLTQLRSDGSPRDVLHLSPGRTISLGREQGEWQFPYDPSMSALHASVRSEDADFVLLDLGSRNGIAVALRAEATLRSGDRLLVGDQLLRVEFS